MQYKLHETTGVMRAPNTSRGRERGKLCGWVPIQQTDLLGFRNVASSTTFHSRLGQKVCSTDYRQFVNPWEWMLVITEQEASACTICDANIRKSTMWRQAIDSQLLAAGQDINMMNTGPTQQCNVYSINTEDMSVGDCQRRGQLHILIPWTESGEVYIISQV